MEDGSRGSVVTPTLKSRAGAAGVSPAAAGVRVAQAAAPAPYGWAQFAGGCVAMAAPVSQTCGWFDPAAADV